MYRVSRERVIWIIRKNILELEESKVLISSWNYEQRSYMKWASSELIQYIKHHEDVPPIYAVEDFRNQMAKYACFDIKTSYIFAVATDLAEEILDILLM